MIRDRSIENYSKIIKVARFKITPYTLKAVKTLKLGPRLVAYLFFLLSLRTSIKTFRDRGMTLRDRNTSFSSHDISCLAKYFDCALAKMSHSHLFFGHLYLDRPINIYQSAHQINITTTNVDIPIIIDNTCYNTLFHLLTMCWMLALSKFYQ